MRNIIKYCNKEKWKVNIKMLDDHVIIEAYKKGFECVRKLELDSNMFLKQLTDADNEIEKLKYKGYKWDPEAQKVNKQ